MHSPTLILCLVIAIKAAQGRMILHCMPITKELSNVAHRVASGTHRVAKIRPTG